MPMLALCHARRSFCLGLAAAACAPALASSAPGGATAPFEVVDLMPEFFSFWAEAEHESAAEAATRFIATIVAAHPDVYAPNVLGYDPEQPDALRRRLEPWLQTMVSRIDIMRRLHTAFASDLEAHSARFMAAFDDFDWNGRVFILASVDAFNGAGRKVGDRGALLFGLDVIARSTPEARLDVLMHHELFHMFQAPRGPSLSDALWVEGLATLASLELNPGATDDQALPISHWHDPRDPQLDVPARRVDWDRDMPGHVAGLGEELLAALSLEDEDAYAQFFLGRASEALGARPVRTGYWFGLQVAREVCGSASVRAFAKRDPATLATRIEAALRSVIAEHAPRSSAT